MKVKDLIQELQKLNPELDVYTLSEDNEITKGKNVAEVFGIKDVSSMVVEVSRDEQYKPKFVFYPVEKGQEVCFINFTSDF